MTNQDNKNLIKKEVRDNNLLLLKTFHAYCKKHNISYRLEAGTLLGAIRHKGFIPWDDDVDVAMTRENYEKLLASVKVDPIGNDYKLLTPSDYKDKHFHDFVTRLFYTGYVYRSEENLNNRYDGMYKYLWLDIFILDDIAISNLNSQVLKLKFVYGLAMGHRYREVNDINKERIDGKTNSIIENIALTILPALGKFFSIDNLIKQYDKLSKKCYGYKNTDAYYYSNYPAIWLGYSINKKMEGEGDYIDIDFEDTKFSVPKNYHEMLTLLYGDYMTPVDEEKQKPDHIKIE